VPILILQKAPDWFFIQKHLIEQTEEGCKQAQIVLSSPPTSRDGIPTRPTPHIEHEQLTELPRLYDFDKYRIDPFVREHLKSLIIAINIATEMYRQVNKLGKPYLTNEIQTISLQSVQTVQRHLHRLSSSADHLKEIINWILGGREEPEDQPKTDPKGTGLWNRTAAYLQETRPPAYRTTGKAYPCLTPWTALNLSLTLERYQDLDPTEQKNQTNTLIKKLKEFKQTISFHFHKLLRNGKALYRPTPEGWHDTLTAIVYALHENIIAQLLVTQQALALPEKYQRRLVPALLTDLQNDAREAAIWLSRINVGITSAPPDNQATHRQTAAEAEYLLEKYLAPGQLVNVYYAFPDGTLTLPSPRTS
jgi:hypothetical protein